MAEGASGASESLLEVVRAHAARVFPGRALETVRWTGGGVVENLPELAFVRAAAPAGAPLPSFVHLSVGASEPPLDDGYGVEFVLETREPEPLALKLLAMVANLHADPRYALSLGQVLEIGHPWLPGARADRLLVALPTRFDAELEWLSERERTIRFAWLVPVTKSEAELVRARGHEALLEQLGAAQVDVAARARDEAV